MARRRGRWTIVIVLLLLAAACAGGAEEQAGQGGAAATSAAARGAGEVAEEPARDGDEVAAAVGAGGGGASRDNLPIPDPQIVRSGERIIKDGTLTVEVSDGGFEAAFAGVVETAAQLGGTVLASTTSTTDDGATSGTVTVRVPVASYEQLLVGVTEVGEVKERSITAQDVTAEFVDLESRLRHLEAQERFYLELLERAASVKDAIAVQQQLEDIQGQVEQIKGRLQFLEERTSFSTLTVELFEPDAPLVVQSREPTRPSLGRYWASAQDAFVNVVGGMLVVGLFLLPLLAPAGLLALAWRLLRRRDAVPAEAS